MRWLLLSTIFAFSLSSWAASPVCNDLHTNIRKGESPEALFRFLDRFETSRATAAAFKKQFEAGTIRLEQLTDEVKTHSSADGDSEIAALFELVGQTPTVYLNSLTEMTSDELGVSAVFFFHEMVHALDAQYAKRIREYRKTALALKRQDKGFEFPSKEYFELEEARTAHRNTRNKMIFDAERLAYDQQRKLLLEIMKNIDCAKEFYDYHEKEENILASELTDAEIRKFYVLLP